MTRYRTIFLCLALSCLGVGCGENPSGALRDFEARWHDAINFREDDKLFFMLDAESQRHLRQDLERLRGLQLAQQHQVIDRLGGERVESLAQLEPEQYFKLLWDRVTQGRRPLMRIREHDDRTGYMVLTINGVDQEIRLSFEGGHWVWRLPTQSIGFDAPPPLVPSGSNPSPSQSPKSQPAQAAVPTP